MSVATAVADARTITWRNLLGMARQPQVLVFSTSVRAAKTSSIGRRIVIRLVMTLDMAPGSAGLGMISAIVPQRGRGFGPVAVTSRWGTQPSTW